MVPPVATAATAWLISWRSTTKTFSGYTDGVSHKNQSVPK